MAGFSNLILSLNSLNLLPCVSFIRLEVRKRRVEIEKGAMEKKFEKRCARQ